MMACVWVISSAKKKRRVIGLKNPHCLYRCNQTVILQIILFILTFKQFNPRSCKNNTPCICLVPILKYPAGFFRNKIRFIYLQQEERDVWIYMWRQTLWSDLCSVQLLSPQLSLWWVVRRGVFVKGEGGGMGCWIKGLTPQSTEYSYQAWSGDRGPYFFK